jgi:hypothetical protein
MLREALLFLKNQLNTYLGAGRNPDESHEDLVVFIDGEKMEPLSFQLKAVSVLLINIEEEKTLRPPDLYRHSYADGTQRQVQPEIRLNLYVLFVARFPEYETGLHYLSLILRYFQNHRLFKHSDTPELNQEIDQLLVELVTLPLAEQNEVWNSLRIAYHPSLLYRIKIVVFRDEDAKEMPVIEERTIRILP